MGQQRGWNQKNHMWPLEKKEKAKEWEARRWTGLSLPRTCSHNSGCSARCQLCLLDTHAWKTHIATHMSFTQEERVSQSQISHPSQLGVQDAGRVNLIREGGLDCDKVSAGSCVHAGPVNSKKKFRRRHAVAAHYKQRDISNKGFCKISQQNGTH